jgi:hypothetical protein
LEQGTPERRFVVWGGFGAGGDNLRAMSAEPNDSERDARFWRRLETEMRANAARMTDAEPGRIMLFIAESYKLLADRVELRKTQKKMRPRRA